MLGLRPFLHTDVSLKVKWINDPRNNRYLHYVLPLEENATHRWLDRVRSIDTRCDLTMIWDDTPIGIIGLLNIDEDVGCAELYITIGEQEYKGKGIARKAMCLLCRKAFDEYHLHEIYLFTETENAAAIHMYEKFGMVQAERRKNDVKNQQGVLVDRYVYSITKDEFEEKYGRIPVDTDLYGRTTA